MDSFDGGVTHGLGVHFGRDSHGENWQEGYTYAYLCALCVGMDGAVFCEQYRDDFGWEVLDRILCGASGASDGGVYE